MTRPLPSIVAAASEKRASDPQRGQDERGWFGRRRRSLRIDDQIVDTASTCLTAGLQVGYQTDVKILTVLQRTAGK